MLGTEAKPGQQATRQARHLRGKPGLFLLLRALNLLRHRSSIPGTDPSPKPPPPLPAAAGRHDAGSAAPQPPAPFSRAPSAAPLHVLACATASPAGDEASGAGSRATPRRAEPPGCGPAVLGRSPPALSRAPDPRDVPGQPQEARLFQLQVPGSALDSTAHAVCSPRGRGAPQGANALRGGTRAHTAPSSCSASQPRSIRPRWGPGHHRGGQSPPQQHGAVPPRSAHAAASLFHQAAREQSGCEQRR